jgi:hypothetical protein
VARGSVVTKPLQHTSIMATLRVLFGTGTLTARDAQARSFDDAFTLDTARTDAPLKLNRPPLQSVVTTDSLGEPLTKPQSEMWDMLALLDGHPDSGKVPPMPATRAEADDYLKMRLAAHEAFHQARRRKADYRVEAVSGGFGWRLLNEDGVPIAASPAPCVSLAAAEAQIAQIRDLAPYARQTDPA